MSAEQTTAKSGDLAVTLATWLYMLDEAGHRPSDDALTAACDTLRSAEAGSDPEALGQALVDAVSASLGDAEDAEAVTAWLGGLYDADSLNTSFGADRDARLRSMRAYQFRSSLPWLARIIDRFPDGTVGPHWVMVERVTELVTCMDPYPWDDLDEEYEAPVVEFMVKWELDGCTSVRWKV